MKKLLVFATAMTLCINSFAGFAMASESSVTPRGLDADYPYTEDTFTMPCQVQNSLGEYVLDGDVTITVSLPASYADSDKEYAVCYMLDGTVMTKNFVHKIYSLDSEEYPEIIYVGVDVPKDSYRSAVLAPPMTTTFFMESQDRGDVDTQLHGIGDYFYGWIATEVKDYIDSNYRTIETADSTGIIGFSSGASGALTAAMLYPDTFTRVGCLSPAFWMWENWYYGVMGNSGYEYSYTTEDGDIRTYTPSIENLTHLFIYIGGLDDNGGTWNAGWSNTAAENVYDHLVSLGAGSESANFVWWDQGIHGMPPVEVSAMAIKDLFGDFIVEEE